MQLVLKINIYRKMILLAGFSSCVGQVSEKLKSNYQQMKRAMINSLSPTNNVILGELERSGNPRSEFHTVAKPFLSEDFITKISDNLIEKITV